MPSDGATPAPIMTALQAQVEALLAGETGVRRGRGPEELRRMRVAVRRLRATLRAGREILGSRVVDGLRRELDWLGAALGAVRDVDLVTSYVAAEVGELSGAARRPGARLLRRLRSEEHTSELQSQFHLVCRL